MSTKPRNTNEREPSTFERPPTIGPRSKNSGNMTDKQTIDGWFFDECPGCGAQGDKMHNRAACPAANRSCYNCDIKGHFGRVCKKPPRSRNGQKMVRVAETTVFPRNGGTLSTFSMCLDTGCTMTLISEDMVTRQGLAVDMRSCKRVRAVNGQKLDNSGMVTFGVEF